MSLYTDTINENSEWNTPISIPNQGEHPTASIANIEDLEESLERIYTLMFESPQRKYSDSFSETILEALLDIQKMIENLKRGSEDVHSFLLAHKAWLFSEIGQWDSALKSIEEARLQYTIADDADKVDDLDDFVCLLDLHVAAIHLLKGDREKAIEILKDEYSPIFDLEQSMIYRLLEEKLGVTLIEGDELINGNGCLDIQRHHFYLDFLGPNKEAYEANAKAILEATYVALRKEAKRAQEMISSLKLDSIQVFNFRQHLAVIQVLNGNLDYFDQVRKPTPEILGFPYQEIVNNLLYSFLNLDPEGVD